MNEKKLVYAYEDKVEQEVNQLRTDRKVLVRYVRAMRAEIGENIEEMVKEENEAYEALSQEMKDEIEK